jgi:glycosyltransferase involved in cell wall biosynthesis
MRATSTIMTGDSRCRQMQISVAVVTRNRPDSLERALRSWRRQTRQPYEIIVSDDSDDFFSARVADTVAHYGARYIKGPRKGLYSNRNHVAIQATGTHVLSADDDHEHPIDLVDKCFSAIQRDPSAIWCLGEVHSEGDIANGWLIPGELHLSGAPRPPSDPSDTWAWSDGATVCPKEVFASGLRFSEEFRFGASYLEFGCLLHFLGYRVRILENTGVIHHLVEGCRSFNEPVEERAALFFALLMLAQVYQRTPKNLMKLNFYFIKQAMRRPLTLAKALPAAQRAKRHRCAWLDRWRSSNRTNAEVAK